MYLLSHIPTFCLFVKHMEGIHVPKKRWILWFFSWRHPFWPACFTQSENQTLELQDQSFYNFRDTVGWWLNKSKTPTLMPGSNIYWETIPSAKRSHGKSPSFLANMINIRWIFHPTMLVDTFISPPPSTAMKNKKHRGNFLLVITKIYPPNIPAAEIRF